MRSLPAVLTLVALGVVLPACGGYVGRAKRAYDEGRYLEASERLSEHEDDVRELSPRRQIDYGIYRGASLMMLGDYAGAELWMNFAEEVAKQVPGEITPAQKALLERGRFNLKQAVRNAQELPRERVIAPPGVGTILVPEPRATTDAEEAPAEEQGDAGGGAFARPD